MTQANTIRKGLARRSQTEARQDRLAHLMNASVAYPGLVGGERIVDSAAWIAAEAGRFAAQRIHTAIEAQQDMLGCSTFAEFYRAQAAYAERLLEDYAGEWLRLTGYALEIGGGGDVPPFPVPLKEKPRATPV
jgi:hypothetical protein